MQKGTPAAGKIGLEIVNRLGAAVVTERDLDAFSRAVDVSRVEHGAAEPREKYIDDRNRSGQIAAAQLRFHFFGYEIMSDEQRAHRIPQRSEVRVERVGIH